MKRWLVASFSLAALLSAGCSESGPQADVVSPGDVPASGDTAADGVLADSSAEAPPDLVPDIPDVAADLEADLAIDVPVSPGDLGTDPAVDAPDAPADLAVEASDPAPDEAMDPAGDAAADVAVEVPADVAIDLPVEVPPDVPVELPGDVPPEAGPRTTPGGLPLELPFTYVRPAAGTPLTDAEVAAFTARITGFLKKVDYFTWAAETSHGMDASTGYPDYLIWWHDVVAERKGDTVIFHASAADGGSHNNAVPTGVVLANAMWGYLNSGDPAMRRIVDQYTKSISACMKGFRFDANDPVDFLMARHIVTRNHEFTMANGKKKAVDYTEWYFPYEGWNADRFRYRDNPIWGDIWVTNKRSKDDLPYWWRLAAWLPYVIELAPDQDIRLVAQETLDLLQKSARDIVESGWKVRTKDAEGRVYVPDDQDLASLVAYTELIPDAECDARLSTALLGHGDPRGVECGSGEGSVYDTIATTTHYFNYDIINHFHMVAALLALTTGHGDVALALVQGLATRIERYRDPASEEKGQSDPSWERDQAMLMLRSAAVGLPLTADEARQVVRFHDQSVEAYKTFPNWDLWAPSVPDGRYSFRDGFHPAHIPEAFQVEDLASIVEYCGSPFRNPASARFVDCDIVLDPSRWGTGGPDEPPPACPILGEARTVGTITSSSLLEVSGLAASRRNKGVLWAHNDSGDTARLVSLKTDGTVLSEVRLKDVSARDWEDISMGPFAGLGEDALFVADIGDNSGDHPSVVIHVLAEPRPAPSDEPLEVPVAASIALTYPGGPVDSESFFVDPANGDFYLVAKEVSEEGLARVFRKAAPHVASDVPVMLEVVGEVPALLPTGADISPDGSLLIIRTYFGGLMYRRSPGATIAEALAAEPCELPSFTNEPQGEAIAILPDRSGFLSVSEHKGEGSQDLHLTPIL